MKRKGFTLVELLAVIVILAIIALITIPIVLKTINNSEIEGEKQSIAGYARAIEDDVANYLMMNPGKSYNDYVTTFNTSVEKGEEPIDYKGNRVKCGPISITDKGKLILTGCIVYKEGDQLTDEQKAKKNHYNYDGKNVELVQNNNNNTSTPSSYDEYKVGDEITVAGEQYYVIADSGKSQDYVTALKANPLTVDEINANKIGSDGVNHVNRYTISNVGTAYDLGDVNHTGGMAYYSGQTCGYSIPENYESWSNSGCTTSYNSSEVKHVIDAWTSAKFTNGELKTVDGYEARLIKLDEAQNLGYSNELSNCGGDYVYYGKSNSLPDWVSSVNYSYWTMTSFQESLSKLWGIVMMGIGPVNINEQYIVVRPVINVYKNKIQ